MKKLTDFIVDKRYLVFVCVLILAFLSIFLFDDIKINRDISKYLPKDSEVRIGMDIMDDEFKDVSTSTLNIMFKGLNKNKKEKILKQLKKYNDLEVEYDDSKKYNKDDYTLYVLNCEFDADSKEATRLYKKIEDKYIDYDISFSGDIHEENKEVLPFYIVVLAIGCALVILIFMCDSYVEPFLFLVSIGIAVLLNKGTNIIFGNISSITDSISSILQLALSMDYSIMLMSRYRQEKNNSKNNIHAMKNALYKAFSSISSSSVTTIVGLLALVFMSFTIGRDLGFVLAKGVMFSLFTIFTCLPALILMCDKLITKTKKKSPVFKLNFLGRYSYKIRYISILLFIGVFVVSFLLKGNLTILYTDSEVDDISRVFGPSNQMALVYNNKYEDVVSKYCNSISKKERVDNVLCYGNTIGDKLSYKKLNKRLKKFNNDFSVDDYLLKIIYYNYYNKNEEKITFPELIKFIKNDVYNNDQMNSHISMNMKKDIDRLENFTNSDLVNRKRTSDEIANIFEIDKDKVDDLLVYYNSLNNNTTITINEFINFMNSYVLNSKYSSSVDLTSKEKLSTISNFTNKNTILRNMDYKEMANLFGMDYDTVSSLYLYYISLNDVDTRLSIEEFSKFTLNNLSSQLDNSVKDKLSLLSKFSNKELINKKLDYNNMALTLGVDPKVMKDVYLLKFIDDKNNSSYTLKDFATYTLEIKNSTHYLDGVDVSSLGGLLNINDTNEYKSNELCKKIGMDESVVNRIYNLIGYVKDTNKWEMSPIDSVNFILNNATDNLSIDMISNLNTLKMVMESSINNKTYSYNELSNLLQIPVNDVKNIYSVYVSKNNNVTISPYNFVNFILNHKNDDSLKGKINNDIVNNLNLLNTIMNSTINNIRYDYNNMASMFGIDKDSMKLLYSLYDFKYLNRSVNLSYKEFVEFLINNVINNLDYSSSFTSEKIIKLNTVNGIINNSINNTKYTKSEMLGIISLLSDDVDNDLIDLLYIYYGSNNSYNNKWKLSLEDFVKYLNEDILKDKRFDDFIDKDMRNKIIDSKKTIEDNKKKLVGNKYSRVVINTKFDAEGKDTFKFIKNILNKFKGKDVYLIGDSPMAYNLNNTFQSELDFITVLTMIFIFVVVMITFKSILIPTILVLLIQTAVYLTMGILSFSGGTVYFIALLIVQSILMGATIDYAILYTSYYLESRDSMGVQKAIINAYNKSIHTIFTSASILIIVTLIVGYFSTAITAKICKTISEGTLCSTILILLLLPAVISSVDKFVVKKK